MTKNFTKTIDPIAIDEINARINDNFYETEIDLQAAGCDQPAIVAAALYSATATSIGYDETQDRESRLNNLYAQRDHIDACIEEIKNRDMGVEDDTKIITFDFRKKTRTKPH